MRIKRAISGLSVLIITGGVAAGCGLIDALQQEVAELLGIDVLGVNPSSDFTRSGRLELATMRTDEGGGIHTGPVGEDDIEMTIDNADGSESTCELVDDTYLPATDWATIAVVVDGSGSMERTYPEEEYGDLCLTCPHDPDRMRVAAARDLIREVHSSVPESELAVMSFGPETASAGWDVTQVLSDFSADTQSLEEAAELVGGSEGGTPLWDSLAEIIGATDASADDLLAYQRTVIVQGNNNTVDCSEYEDGDDVIVQGNNNTVVGCGDGNGGSGDDVTDNDDDVTTPPVDVDDSVDDDRTPRPDVIEGVGRYIVVISDGDDRDSLTHTLDSVIELALENDIVIHAIGLGPASASFDSPLLRAEEQVSAVTALERLAEETGGFYASVNDPDALRALYTNIARSLTHGYSSTTFDCSDAIEAGEIEAGDRVSGAVDALGRSQRFSFIVR